MSQRVGLRRGVRSNWMLHDPVLSDGEPAVETDTDQLKIGDGVSRWSDLPYLLLNSNRFLSATKVAISSTMPVSPAAGSIWIECETGVTFDPVPDPPTPESYTGTVDFTGAGTFTAHAAPTYSGGIVFTGSGTLTATGH